MVRESPLDRPDSGIVAEAAARATGRSVARVRPVDEGLNAVYRVAFADDDTTREAVLKAATFANDAEFLPEPRLLSLLADGPVPVPAVLATVGADESPFDAAFCLTEFVPGRHVADALSLPPAVHERLVREAGRHLAGVHDLDVARRAAVLGGPYGDLRTPGGDPARPMEIRESGRSGSTDDPGHDAWPARLASVVDRVADGLAGETLTSGGQDRFADLVPVVREAVEAATIPESPPVATIHGDLRPANLVLAGDEAAEAGGADDAAPLVRAVLDFGTCETGDGLLDLALAENALVEVPLGGTDRGDRLATSLRTAYAASRSADVGARLGLRGGGPDESYRAYLLLARAKRLGSFGYMAQFAREADPEAVATRWRGSVAEAARRLG